MAENEIPEPPDWSDARTFFLEPDLWHEPYELDASESHHLTRVLRIREGDYAVELRVESAEKGIVRVSRTVTGCFVDALMFRALCASTVLCAMSTSKEAAG